MVKAFLCLIFRGQNNHYQLGTGKRNNSFIPSSPSWLNGFVQYGQYENSLFVLPNNIKSNVLMPDKSTSNKNVIYKVVAGLNNSALYAKIIDP